MRIAIVRQRYNPYGGAERFIERALPALERAGIEATLIARSAEGWGARRVIRVDPFYVGSLWRDWSFARRARETWQREGFDFVQSHERIPGCEVYRAGDGVHARWLELRAAAAGPAERARIALNPHHRYLCAAERRMFEHSKLRAVICNSEMVRGEILGRFRVAPEKLHVIRNGVDLARFHPRERAARRVEARERFGCGAADTVFAFVGSGFARKGLAAAIGALAAARDGRFRLLVAGRDRHRAAFEARARSAGLAAQVRFLGAGDEVRPLYAAADCYILPSRYDPFPNTALEALAMGLPLIVSSRCGAAELVERGENGWVCEPDDPAGLARLMHEAAASVGRLSGAARATAERFGIERTAAELGRLYAALAADRGATP